MITCPKCGANTGVTETRATTAGLRRRRRCVDLQCDYRITTLEFVVSGTGAEPSPTNRTPPTGEIALVPMTKLRKLVALVDSIRGSNHVPIPKSWTDVWNEAATTGGQDG